MNTPECSLCGYAVEWLRSCYASRWRLFAGSTTVTPGEYYFTPHGVPFAPYPHLVGSANWTTQDFGRTGPPLGELQNPRPRRPWRSGKPPLFPPLPQLVGDEPCVENGETPGVTPAFLINGYPLACWISPPPIEVEGMIEQAQDLFFSDHFIYHVAQVEDFPATFLVELRVSDTIREAQQVRAVANVNDMIREAQDKPFVASEAAYIREAQDTPFVAPAVDLVSEAEDVQGTGYPPVDYFGCGDCPLGTYSQWKFTLAGCTGDFAVFNGTQHLTLFGACQWEQVATDPTSSLLFLLGATVSISAIGGFLLEFEGPRVCDAPFTVPFNFSLGTGTHPSFVLIEPDI